MRSASYRLEDLRKETVIPIGFEGENEFTRINIDCKRMFDEDPEYVPTLIVTAPSGEKYPAVLIREGNIVTWNISAADLAQQGTGEMQFAFTHGTVIGKTWTVKTRIERSITPTGEAPAVIANWMAEANAALARIDEAVQVVGIAETNQNSLMNAMAAVIELAVHLVYTDENGSQYVARIQEALAGAEKTVSSISAVFTQGSTVVYDTDALSSLQSLLAVTATYSDGSTSAVSSYSLSGTLSEGESVITVSYDGKTTTFTVDVTVSPVSYTADVLYSNYAGSGSHFSKNNVSINFAAGDYLEAQIDTTTCLQDAENILAIGKNSDDYIGSYNSAVAILFYKRLQSGVNKILARVKDSDSSITIDKWVEVSDLSRVTIQIDKNGVCIDGTYVSGMTSQQITYLLGLGTYTIGARASALSNATYDHITVYRQN